MGVVISASGDCISRLTNLPSSTNYTIMCWAKRRADRNNYSDVLAIRVAPPDSTNKQMLGTSTDGDDVAIYVTSFSATIVTMSNDAWFFLCLKSDATTLTGLGRQEAAETLTTATAGASSYTPGVIAFGDKYAGGGEWFDGKIANVKIWNDVLSDAEILAESGQLSPIITGNLHSWFLLDDVATIEDQGPNGYDLTADGTVEYDSDMPGIPMGGDPVYEATDFRIYDDDGTGLGETA